jgi:hypothetical protein
MSLAIAAQVRREYSGYVANNVEQQQAAPVPVQEDAQQVPLAAMIRKMRERRLEHPDLGRYA